MQYLSVALPLAALASGALAGPFGGSCAQDSCLAAVTGKAALGDGSIRASHCASFLYTVVTPPAITVTETITATGNNGLWPRASVTVCPNQVPNYASACTDNDAYSSACSCYGYTDVKTSTLAPTTTTKTVFVKPTGSACVSGTATVTSTVTVGSGTPSTVTVTVTSSGSWPSGSGSPPPPSKCNVDDALATQLVENFMDLLRFTSYNGTQGPPGHGYNQSVSDATLATDFVDISDSINFMAGFALGSVTFPNKYAFDIGQGHNQPEVVINALNIWHDCNSITWRWLLHPLVQGTSYPITGINYMIINDDKKIQKNYAEFDNGAWLQSFGQKCAVAPVTVAASPALKIRQY